MILSQKYFLNHDTIQIAHDLIGKTLCRNLNGLIKYYTITETEAYHGMEDKACHGRHGKTARNEVMFGEGGHIYVYLCYGIHWMLNIVTGAKDFPAAILIRGINNIHGPGLVTKELQLNKEINSKLLTPESGLWIEDNNIVTDMIIATPRIGIDYAKEYKEKPWRFLLK